jgi:Sulfotransferase domain
MSSSGALPNLIIIGAQKCGTTSLHNYLDSHPEISMSRIKEMNFFLSSSNWDRGVEWYASHFDPSAPVRGEASPNYTNLPESRDTAERIHSVVPSVKLIYLVRDPLERMASGFVHRQKLGLERRSFAEAVMDPDSHYVARSRYASQLRPFLRLFPREQILVETQERLLRDREMTLRGIFRFLEVDDGFTSPEFGRIWEQTEGKGLAYSLAARAVVRLPESSGALPRTLRWPFQRLLRSRLLGGRKTERPVYDERLRQQARQWFKDEVEELQELTGLDLKDWLA